MAKNLSQQTWTYQDTDKATFCMVKTPCIKNAITLLMSNMHSNCTVLILYILINNALHSVWLNSNNDMLTCFWCHILCNICLQNFELIWIQGFADKNCHFNQSMREWLSQYCIVPIWGSLANIDTGVTFSGYFGI